ncbi:MAG: hypothetical protein H6813_03240 [Phycisphaeraceae bacterium]|nr:hypothetical protein [Phycisphaeraceae bacterium]MCB9846960.1 hypothetical protein [Phycisphaeraceae bacterium]
MTGKCIMAAAVAAAGLAMAAPASATIISFMDSSGLSAEAEFTLLNPNQIQIRLKNTSTGVPMGFDSADQLLTGLTWDTFGVAGQTITGGTAITGPDSSSIGFNHANVGPGGDVGGEWGYGMGPISGLSNFFITGNMSGQTLFGGANLDGPANGDGPQAGLVADPALVALGGTGAIQDEIIVTINLSLPQPNLDFLSVADVYVEYGSDAAFVHVPTPGSLALFGVAGVAAVRRRR